MHCYCCLLAVFWQEVHFWEWESIENVEKNRFHTTEFLKLFLWSVYIRTAIQLNKIAFSPNNSRYCNKYSSMPQTSSLVHPFSFSNFVWFRSFCSHATNIHNFKHLRGLTNTMNGNDDNNSSDSDSDSDSFSTSKAGCVALECRYNTLYAYSMHLHIRNAVSRTNPL